MATSAMADNKLQQPAGRQLPCSSNFEEEKNLLRFFWLDNSNMLKSNPFIGGCFRHSRSRHPFITNYLASFFFRNYWRDPDTALFILKHLYRDLPKDPDSFCHESQGGGSSSKDENSSTEWCEQREEDLPLTFADRIFVNRLTGKVEYLYRAKAFASFLHDRAQTLISEGIMHGGDRPYSLFEGIRGMAYLFLDMTEPFDARFPAYEL
ncbi:hypothetical protein M9H77_07029 [Catharanthus roseus]|uniref:Uncharacterized protein n=1 Tax=Catharanthus roseus TaxID=4058 RepID=A0ACC0BU03_CATRO|nr:hypothetical protein M9H77_07029 [Catharanthus roseus]